VERGGALVLATLALYVWVAPPAIVFGDNAELSGLYAQGGVAHPPGYPLYVLWLRAWSWLPVSTPAHGAAIATAILGALAVLIVHAAARAWGAHPTAATFAAGLYAAGPIIMSIHTEAEVFALNAVLVALVVWLSAHAAPLRGLGRVAVLALVAGLALSNHHTCVLAAPIGLLGVGRGIRESSRPWPFGVALAIVALAVGLLPYAYLFVAPDSWLSWTPISSMHDLTSHFFRESYGGPGTLAAKSQSVSVSTSLVAMLVTWGRSFLWVPVGVGIAGAVRFTLRGDRGETRAAWATLLASLVLAGPLLVSRFNIDPSGVGRYVTSRLHLLSVLLLVVPIAVTTDRVAARFAPRISARWRTAVGLQAAVVVVGLSAVAASSLPFVARVHSPAVETALRNELETLPQNAIVIGDPDEFHFGLGYLQGVLGERRDVAVIAVPHMGITSYRRRIAEMTGIEIRRNKGGEKLSVVIAEQALATGRPVFIDPLQGTIASRFPTYPYGLLFRVLPAGTPPPSIDEVFAINKELYGTYKFGYATPSRDGELAAQYHLFYARAWQLLIPALEATGRTEERAFAQAMIAELLPRE
jgi:hypothetical protein